MCLLLVNKTLRPNFNSLCFQLLHFGHITALLSNENTFLTFDLYMLLKHLSPFPLGPLVELVYSGHPWDQYLIFWPL